MARNIFAQEPMRKTRTNHFDLSNTHNTSTKFGRITPTMVREVLPGDHFNIRSENLIRFQSLLAPVMHNVKAYTHFFFVPNRILWENWEDFITGGRLGNAAPPIPRFEDAIEPQQGSLADYLGLPIDVEINPEDLNILVFAAYQKIYYDYYIDRNLDATEFRPLADGDNNSLMDYAQIRNRAWRKDYFTSALPWAQRGSSVNLPLGDEAPVFAETGEPTTDITIEASTGGSPLYLSQDNKYDSSIPSSIGRLYTDLTEATASTVNDLRRAMRLQEFFEKLARGGSRYFEVLRSFFGSRNLDARLDRAEYIGGNIQPVVISEVLQTSATDGGTPLAEMAGHGVSVSSGKTSKYTCHEHGFIIGLTTLMPEAVYTQGLPRQYSRSDRFDYYWSSFAHIGEQEILNKELYYASFDDTNQDVFGYTPRYSEYRYNPNISTGAMRTTLDYWTFARRFDNRPLLNNDFIQMDGDNDYFANAFAGGANEDYILMQIRNHVKARRAVARHGIPSI